MPAPVVESSAALAETYALHLGGQIPITYRCELLGRKIDRFRRSTSGGPLADNFGRISACSGILDGPPVPAVTGEVPVGAEASDLHATALGAGTYPGPRGSSRHNQHVYIRRILPTLAQSGDGNQL